MTDSTPQDGHSVNLEPYISRGLPFEASMQSFRDDAIDYEDRYRRCVIFSNEQAQRIIELKAALALPDGVREPGRSIASSSPSLASPSSTFASSQDFMLPFPDPIAQLRAIIVRIVQTRSNVAGALRNWSLMESHAVFAADLARTIGHEPLIAQCHYNRGISLYRQNLHAEALRAFEAVKPAANVFLDSKEVEFWTTRVQKEGLAADDLSEAEEAYYSALPSPMTGWESETAFDDSSGSTRVRKPRLASLESLESGSRGRRIEHTRHDHKSSSLSEPRRPYTRASSTGSLDRFIVGRDDARALIKKRLGMPGAWVNAITMARTRSSTGSYESIPSGLRIESREPRDASFSGIANVHTLENTVPHQLNSSHDAKGPFRVRSIVKSESETESERSRNESDDAVSRRPSLAEELDEVEEDNA